MATVRDMAVKALNNLVINLTVRYGTGTLTWEHFQEDHEHIITTRLMMMHMDVSQAFIKGHYEPLRKGL